MAGILERRSLVYTGKPQPAPGEKDARGLPLYPYLPDDELVEDVNFAIQLKRPLLLKGEPGSGKTQLARAVSYELNLPYQEWHVKSTSKARDGLYLYDNVARLRDAQLASRQFFAEDEMERIVKRVMNSDSYVRYGPLGRAFQSEKPTIVLIDEIDKADIDFPNDLLLALEELRFYIEEIEKPVRAKPGAEPIIFITSNDEKDLPDAFLRRCLFHYIEFPAGRLEKIVEYHFRPVSPDLVRKAVACFQKLREKMEEKGEAGKKVSTSELLDWFRILKNYPTEEALSKIDGKLPLSILLKSWEDHKKYMGLTGRGLIGERR